MTYNIIGCGHSASKYDGHGLSIGVNDCFKYGHRPSLLLVCNHKNRFPAERRKTILDTRPVTLYTTSQTWDNDFPSRVMVNYRSWDGNLRQDVTRLTSANTSPIMAMSLAYSLGATKLILWGVDFIDHSDFSKSNPETKLEIRQYRGFTEALRREGIKTYLGAAGSALEEFLTVRNGQE